MSIKFQPSQQSIYQIPNLGSFLCGSDDVLSNVLTGYRILGNSYIYYTTVNWFFQQTVKPWCAVAASQPDGFLPIHWIGTANNFGTSIIYHTNWAVSIVRASYCTLLLGSVVQRRVFLIVSGIVSRSCPWSRFTSKCTFYKVSRVIWAYKTYSTAYRSKWYIWGSNMLKFNFKDRAYIENSD